MTNDTQRDVAFGTLH